MLYIHYGCCDKRAVEAVTTAPISHLFCFSLSISEVLAAIVRGHCKEIEAAPSGCKLLMIMCMWINVITLYFI